MSNDTKTFEKATYVALVKELTRQALILMEHRGGKVLEPRDIQYAAKRCGLSVYSDVLVTQRRRRRQQKQQTEAEAAPAAVEEKKQTKKKTH